MESTYKTPRLFLRQLSETDGAFIMNLVNSAGWLKFIGDRNVHSMEEAVVYIKKILSSEAVNYRVVTLPGTDTAVGIITFIKRDFLEHPDIGFAFLPAFTGQGYAYEAATAVLDNLLKSGKYPTIFATTLLENSSSIRLLKKLGFTFSQEVIHKQDTVQLYYINAEKLNAGLYLP